MKLKVQNIIDSNIAVSSKKGTILFNAINEMLSQENEVIVDFYGISDLTTAFLNVAIGHLYTSHSGEVLNKKLRLINLDELDSYLVSQVIERVKMNQAEEKEFTDLIKEVLEDGDDT